ncbi:hypothetical protein ACHQM5_008210 [Ranunculus cassubicifolius]
METSLAKKRRLSYRNWLDLPNEITGQILSRLDIKDLLRCQTVCKSWYNVTRDLYFIKLQCERGGASRVILQSKPEEFKVRRQREYKRTVRMIMESCVNGMLCVNSGNSGTGCGDEGDLVYLYNPISNKCLKF